MKLISCPRCDGVKRFVEYGTSKHFCEECDAELERIPQDGGEAVVRLNNLLSGLKQVEDLYQKFLEANPNNEMTADENKCPLGDGTCMECGYLGAYIKYLRDI